MTAAAVELEQRRAARRERDRERRRLKREQEAKALESLRERAALARAAKARYREQGVKPSSKKKAAKQEKAKKGRKSLPVPVLAHSTQIPLDVVSEPRRNGSVIAQPVLELARANGHGEGINMDVLVELIVRVAQRV